MEPSLEAARRANGEISLDDDGSEGVGVDAEGRGG